MLKNIFPAIIYHKNLVKKGNHKKKFLILVSYYNKYQIKNIIFFFANVVTYAKHDFKVPDI